MVKNILPLLAAAASAQDSTLEVSLDIDNAEVARGSNVMYSCSWSLSADYGKFLFEIKTFFVKNSLHNWLL